MKGEIQLYFAFLIADPTRDAERDRIDLYLDSPPLEGDPAEGDRFIALGRDGSLVVRSGLGSNGDGRGWSEPIEADGILAAVSEPIGGGWSAEVAIDLATQLPSLVGDQGFGSLISVVLGDDTAVWPEAAETDDLATWVQLDNVSCVDGG